MSGILQPTHSAERKMTAQEVTPNTGKTTDGVPAHFSLDVLSTPSKRSHRKKHLMEENKHSEGSAEKRACLSSESSCVRRPLIVLLSGLKAEADNRERSEVDSDQESSTDNFKSRSKTTFSYASKHNTLNISSRNTPVESLKEDATEKKFEMPPEMSCRNKRLVVKLVRLREESVNLDEETFEETCNNENDLDQEQMELSAYERERLKNIKDNAKFLNSIKLLESAASYHPPKKNRTRVAKRGKPQNTGSTVVRRSMRQQNITPSQVKLDEQAPTVEEYVQRMKPPGPIEMIPVNQQKDHSALDQFLRMWTSISQKTVKAPTNMYENALKNYITSMKKMKLRAEDVAKVVPGRILSVAIHPSERQLLVAAGDKYGNVGLWNLEDQFSDMEIYNFELHSRHVACLSFCPWNPAHLLSLSYDGSARCGDVTRCVFDEIYRDEEENFSSFDYLSADGSVLIVSHWDSKLSLMDRRTPGMTYEVRAPVDLSSPRTVSVHPLQRELCAVAGARDVCVYDVRQLSRKKVHPVISLPGHTRVVYSAFFSPVTGNRILTTCADNHLRVYDSSSLGSTVPLLTSIRHNNFTGRWLSRFQAVWDPKKEDCFVIGSMDRPRQIEVFHEDGKLMHVFWDSENLNSVCSINASHPTRSVIVGGNSSGRLHVFQNQSG
ncbi:WD repeat-containing protein 76 [Mantella aurantiaca]